MGGHVVHVELPFVDDFALRVHGEVDGLGLIHRDVDPFGLVLRFLFHNAGLLFLFLLLYLAPLLFSFGDHDAKHGEVFLLQPVAELVLGLELGSVEFDGRRVVGPVALGHLGANACTVTRKGQLLAALAPTKVLQVQPGNGVPVFYTAH